MTRKRILVFLLLLAIFAVSFLILTFDVFGEETSPRVYNISVIVRGKNSDSWESIKQGVEQAASEMQVDFSFITLTEENNIDEQIFLLDREFASGVDAIVLSAADSEGLGLPIQRIAEKIPVICIESTVHNPTIRSYVCADDYQMGIALGQEIVDSGNARKRLAIIESSLGCSNVQQRLDGLMSVLDTIGGKVIRWSLPDNPNEIPTYLAKQLGQKAVDTIVTLDVAGLELTAQAVSDAQAYYLDLFGIGATGKIASFLEQDIVSATIVQNDFSIGYLGIKSAVDALENRTVTPVVTVEHRMINRSNMYDRDNQRLLFPFIR